MSLCENIATELAGSFREGLFCGPDEAGYEVLNTPFLYPDRDSIQVFLKEVAPGQILVSDLGQTITKLSEYGFNPASAPRRRAMINQIVASMNVRYDRGIVSVALGSSGDAQSSGQFGSRVWDLVIALQRLSDLAFTVAAYARATFSDEFEGFIVQRDISYRRGGRIDLRTGYSFLPDFVIAGTKIVQLLAAASPGYARERLDRVYVNFSELKYADDERERLAVLDDSQPVWESEELILPLTHVDAKVVRWSQKRALERVLVA
jgi:hypothetical protein